VLDNKNRVFTWGFGGYGRLGHDENKDEWVPRLLKFFDGPNRGAMSIAAGSTFTMAINKLGRYDLACGTKCEYYTESKIVGLKMLSLCQLLPTV
jgi:alpha-tubulin suppressor-like RCC1 family protein